MPCHHINASLYSIRQEESEQSDSDPEDFLTPIQEHYPPYFDAKSSLLRDTNNAIQQEESTSRCHIGTNEATNMRNNAGGDGILRQSNAAMPCPAKVSPRPKLQTRRSDPPETSRTTPTPIHMFLHSLINDSVMPDEDSKEASSVGSGHPISEGKRSTAIPVVSGRKGKSSIPAVLPKKRESNVKRFLSGLDDSDLKFGGHRDSVALARSRLLRNRHVPLELFELGDTVPIAQGRAHANNRAQSEDETTNAVIAKWEPLTSLDAAIMTSPLPDSSTSTKDDVWGFSSSGSGSLPRKKSMRGHCRFVIED